MQTSKLLIFLASRWGSQLGGENVFNYGLATALARIKPKGITPVCVVSECTEDDRSEALGAGLHLIQLEEDLPAVVSCEDFQGRLASQLPREVGDLPVGWIVGHDIHTGPLALLLKRKFPQAQSVLIMHSSPIDYLHLTRSPETLSERRLKQVTLFSEADRVCAVGPLLVDRLREIRPDAFELIPGLSNSRPTSSKDRLSITLAGRFDPEDEPLKNLRTAAEVVIRAWKASRWKRGSRTPRPLRLELFGVSKAEQSLLDRKLRKKAHDRDFLVTVHPFLTDRRTFLTCLRTSSLSLMPSVHEGFGLVAWEAIGAGLPVVISEKSGLFDLLKRELPSLPSCVGILSPTGSKAEDAEQLLSEVIHLIDHLEAVQREAGELRDILINEKGFTWESCAVTFVSNLTAGHLADLRRKEAAMPSGEDRSASYPLPPFSNLGGFRRLATVDEGFEYLSTKFLSAGDQIDHAAFAPPIPGWKSFRESSEYEKAVGAVVEQNRVFYRYVGGVRVRLQDAHRLEGIQRLLGVSASESSYRRYTPAAYLLLEQEVGLNFCLFDRSELFLYLPGPRGTPGSGFVTAEPLIIDGFRSYFDLLWADARLLTTLDTVRATREALVSLHAELGRLWASHGMV